MILKSQLGRVASWISRLEGKKGGEIYNDDDISIIFESRPLHDWGVKLQGMSLDWVFPKVTIRGAIIICNMVFQLHQVQYLKFFSYDNSMISPGVSMF